MKLYNKNIFWILCSSCLIGLVYNHFNPEDLDLIRQERILDWESDLTSNTLKDKSLQIDSTNKKDELPNNSINSVGETQKKKRKKDVNDSKSFDKPKAIKIDFAYNLFKEGKKFIDARAPEEYAEGHIKGAINIPFYGSENYESVLNEINKEEVIVTYCNGDDCDLSILLADEIFGKGFKKVYIFFGGWNDWKTNNYPIENIK
jgi:rhodanese-related sulfurtransferase